MNAERWARLKAALAEALEAPPRQRDALLDRACGNDKALRAEADAYLAAYDTNTFLEQGVADAPLKTPSLKRAGPYRLVRELGRGGMGVVYLAHRDDQVCDREVAVKLLQPGLASDQIIERFHKERQILANLSHPHIARLYDGGQTEQGAPYLVMEYVEGEPIHRYCRQRGLSVAERLRLFQKVCSAVHFAHQNLVVHRDIKPGNILVTADGEPKLLDFGIAKSLSPDPVSPITMTALGRRALTYEYASPEQARGAVVSTASDIYSLGVLCYELLTDRRPYRFPNRDERDIQRVICEEKPPRPSAAVAREPHTGEPGQDEPADARSARKLSRLLRGDLDKIVLKALRKEPERRYASAEQFSDDIGRHLAGYPVSARKETLFYFASKFFRRHRWSVSAAAAGAALVLGLTASMTVQRQQTLRERNAKERVAELFEEIFRAPDPYAEASGWDRAERRDLTVRAFMDNAADRIERDFKGEPELLSTLTAVIGAVYLNLEHHDQARPLLERALDTRRALFGEDSVEAAGSLYKLGLLLCQSGEYAESQKLLERALTIQTQRLGEAAPATVDTLDTLGLTHYYQDQYDEALRLFDRSLALRGQGKSPDQRKLGEAHNHLGLIHYRLGHYEAAEESYRQAVALAEQSLGADHPRLAEFLDNWGILYRRLGRYGEAESLFNRAFSIRNNLFGPETPPVAASLNNLALLHLRQKRYAEAEPLFRQALRIREQTLGPETRETANGWNNLAMVCLRLEKYADCEAAHLRALTIRRKLFGEDSVYVGASMHNLANLYFRWDRPAQSEKLQRQAKAVFEAKLGPDHPNLAHSLHSLALLCHAQARFVEAAQHGREALRIREQALGETHALTVETAKLLGEIERSLAGKG